MFVSCYHCKVTPPTSFSCCALWKEATTCSPYLQGIDINYLKFFCTGNLSLVPYLFIDPIMHLFLSVMACGYLCYILDCNPILWGFFLGSLFARFLIFTWVIGRSSCFPLYLSAILHHLVF